MKIPFLFDLPILPRNFKFPESYLEMARNSTVSDLEPWIFLFSDMPKSLSYYGAMLQKYKDKPLIPFAMVDDKSGFYNDGYVVLACFDGDDVSGNPKVYFHDYSKFENVELSWSGRYQMANFSEWLVSAKDESNLFKQGKYNDN